MEEKQTLVITDTSKIKKVHFKYPELVSSDAEQKIKDLYSKVLDTKERLYDSRKKVIELEKELDSIQKEYNAMTYNCTIEFETYSKEYKTTKSNLFIKGQGNDLLGTFGN